MSGPLVQAIGWALLHLLWQGVLVAAILAATLALLRRQSANARYLASCGALLLLIGLGVATGYRLYAPQANVTAGPSAGDVPAGEPAPTLLPDSAPAEAAPDAIFGLISLANAHLAQVVAIWLAGVLILSTRLIIGWIGAHRLAARRSHPVGERWQGALSRIATALQLRQKVRLLESAVVEVPTVVGWLRPIVLLPVASLSGLSMQQIEMILAHELAHIRRHDFIINLLQSVVETLLFYHPAVWWISRRIRVEREHCCDDLAVAVFGDPLQYARALTRFEELRLDAPQSVLAASGGSLISRIRRLVVARAESANWSSRWAAGAALLTVVAAIVVAPALPVFANHDGQTPRPSPAPAPAPAPAPEKSDNPKTCDKASVAHTTVEVDATDASDDSETDAEADTESDVVVAPHAIAIPHVAVGPIVNGAVTRAIEASSTAIAEIVGDQFEGRHARHRKIGEGGKLTVDDLIALRTAGVDSKYINDLRNAGLGELSLDEIVALRLQGVTSAYIKELREVGLDIRSADMVVALRVQGVDAKYVREMAAAGYSNLTARELTRLKASGVDADFIRELSKYRTK